MWVAGALKKALAFTVLLLPKQQAVSTADAGAEQGTGAAAGETKDDSATSWHGRLMGYGFLSKSRRDGNCIG
jgi:hypothetical protein